jgi:hypothetical protein
MRARAAARATCHAPCIPVLKQQHAHAAAMPMQHAHAAAMQQPCPCWLLLVAVAGCSLLLAAAAGCGLLLGAAASATSPGGIFEEFLEIFEINFEKKGSKFFGDTLSRIVIDHKTYHPPSPSSAPSY